jgi:hypothetical protein
VCVKDWDELSLCFLLFASRKGAASFRKRERGNKHYERRAPPFTHVFSSFLYGDTTQRYEVPVAAMLLPGRRETVMFLLFVNGIPASRLLHPEEESFDNVSHEVSMLQVIGYA